MSRHAAAPALALALALVALAAWPHSSAGFVAPRRGADVALRGGRTIAAAEGAAVATQEPSEDELKAEQAGGVVGAILFIVLANGSLVAGLFGALVGYLAAVSTRKQGSPASNAGFDPTQEMGAMAPLGYWDPAGLMRRSIDGVPGAWEWKDESTFRQYRTAELKHGRVCMVALTGMFAATKFRFPGDIFQSSETGWQVAGTEIAGAIGILALAVGFIELENPLGNFEDPLGVYQTGSSLGDFDELREKELAHGRLAMSAVLTLWLYEYGANVSLAEIWSSRPGGPFSVAFLALFFVWFPFLYDEKEAYGRTA